MRLGIKSINRWLGIMGKGGSLEIDQQLFAFVHEHSLQIKNYAFLANRLTVDIAWYIA
jgi:hypothetical protein